MRIFLTRMFIVGAALAVAPMPAKPDSDLHNTLVAPLFGIRIGGGPGPMASTAIATPGSTSGTSRSRLG
jgi:hypothetical protein